MTDYNRDTWQPSDHEKVETFNVWVTEMMYLIQKVNWYWYQGKGPNQAANTLATCFAWLAKDKTKWPDHILKEPPKTSLDFMAQGMANDQKIINQLQYQHFEDIKRIKHLEGYLKMVEDLKQNIINLLNQIGDPGTCKGCSAPIFWVVHKNGKKVPYTETGLNHFADCPDANRFRKGPNNEQQKSQKNEAGG